MESSDASVLALQGAECLIHDREKGAFMARATMTVPLAQEETTLPRGRRPKRGKAPTKLERLERLRERILSLVPDLLAAQGAVNFRVITDDYYAIVPEGTDPGSSEVRRAYRNRQAYADRTARCRSGWGQP